jgi:hypothetical protein
VIGQQASVNAGISGLVLMVSAIRDPERTVVQALFSSITFVMYLRVCQCLTITFVKNR